MNAITPNSEPNVVVTTAPVGSRHGLVRRTRELKLATSEDHRVHFIDAWRRSAIVSADMMRFS